MKEDIDKMVELAKERADYFKPEAEVILASTVKSLLNSLYAKMKDDIIQSSPSSSLGGSS